MSAMTKLIGLRIRNYRIQSGLNQEQLLNLPDAILHISVRLNEARKTLQ